MLSALLSFFTVVGLFKKKKISVVVVYSIKFVWKE
jgi:hypothetical protein